GHAHQSRRPQRLPEERPGNKGGAGRDQEEEAGEPGGGPPTDQDIHQGDGAQRKDEDQPKQREEELAAPLDPILLEDQGKWRGGEGGGEELHDVATAQVHAGAVALLVERAEGDGEERGDAGKAAQRAPRALPELVGEHEANAEEAEAETAPLA